MQRRERSPVFPQIKVQTKDMSSEQNQPSMNRDFASNRYRPNNSTLDQYNESIITPKISSALKMAPTGYNSPYLSKEHFKLEYVTTNYRIKEACRFFP